MDLQNDLTGKYRCEFSSEALDFHTQVVSSQKNVVSKYTLLERIITLTSTNLNILLKSKL